jgi:TolB-like protein
VQFLFEDYTLDIERRELRRGAQQIAVEPQVFDLLVYLVRNRERVVTKDDLLEAVWSGRFVSESNLTTRINAARKAVGDSGQEQRLIRTVARKGVRFVGLVTSTAENAGDVPVSTAATQMALSIPDKPSIAVLPFKNMSGDPDQEYFADGVVEEIITALSRFRQLFVIARNSTFTYKGRAVDVKQVSLELGVRYALEGSVRKSANQVRISAQLIDATTAAHLWADRFDGGMDDIFDLQDRVTASVVNAIAPALQQAELERAKRKPTENLDAYDYFLRAMANFHRWTREATCETLRLCHKAIQLDPDFALAYAVAGFCYVARKMNGWMTDRDHYLAQR